MRTSLKTSTKKVHAAVAEGDAEAATQQALEASRALDKAASKGIVHKKTAARRKSRLVKAANGVAAPSSTARTDSPLRRDLGDQHRHHDVAGRARLQRSVGVGDAFVQDQQLRHGEVARLLLVAAPLPLEPEPGCLRRPGRVTCGRATRGP